MAASLGDSCGLESQHFRTIQTMMLQADAYPVNDGASPAQVDVPDSRSLVRDAAPGKVPFTRSAPDMAASLQLSLSAVDVSVAKAPSLPVSEVVFDGDTQPMPSDVYANYRSRLGVAPSPVPVRQTGSMHDDGDGTASANGTPAGGGHINLLEGWETQVTTNGTGLQADFDAHSVRVSMEDDADMNGLLSSSQQNVEVKTPAIMSRKRDRYGRTVSPSTVVRTPGSGLTNAFGTLGARPLMTATQMFDNTQGLSSPLGDAIRSDPAETRPSPEFNHISVVSPSVHAMTSPVKPAKAPPSSAPGGLRDTYRRMDESQRKRARIKHLGPVSSSSKVTFDDDSQEQARPSSTLIPARFTTGTADTTMKSFSEQAQQVTAAGAAPYSRAKRLEGSLQASHVIELSDHQSDSADDESIDEYDELEQDVRPSQKRISSQNSLHHSDTPELLDHGTEVAGSPLEGRVTASQPLKPSQGYSSRPLEPSSMLSFVPGSQIPALSSQARAQLNHAIVSSSIPQPPSTLQPLSGLLDTHLQSSPPACELRSSPEVPRPLLSYPTERRRKNLPEEHGPDARCSGDEQEIQNRPVGIVTTTRESPGRTTRADASTSRALDSTRSTVYDTARTQRSVPHSAAASALTRARLISESPQKAAKMRSFKDIANEPTSQMSIGDIDTSVGLDIVQETDEQYLRALRSPKRSARHVRSCSLKLHGAVTTGNACNTLTEPGEIGHAPDMPDFPSAADAAESPSRKKRSLTSTYIGARGRRGHAEPPTSTETAVPLAPASCAAASRDMIRRGERTVTTDVPTRRGSGGPVKSVSKWRESDSLPTTAMTANQPADRVLALFNGSVTGYYPATCLSNASKDPMSRLEVRFDDGTCTTLDRHHVCAFDLHVNDVVKVDLPKMRTHMYTVVGFGEKEAEAPDRQLVTDVHSHTLVTVQIKPKESSRNLKVKATTTTVVEPISIPIGCVYVTQSMWIRYAARRHEEASPATRQGTPSLDLTAPPTPSSRTRRQTLNLGNLTHLSSTVATTTVLGRAFENMAFAVSFDSSSGLTTTQRDAIVQHIKSHSGLVLEDGIHELFEDIGLSSLGGQQSPPPCLRVKPRYTTLGFVATIADSFSRKSKYIQALALSLPTLHYKWIEDSIAAEEALPWSRYLLPAGQSDHLDKAVRSRCLSPYDPTTASFSQILTTRDRWLPSGTGGVLLFGDRPSVPARRSSKDNSKPVTSDTKSSSSAAFDMRHTFAFLSLAMGADNVAFSERLDEVAAAVSRSDGAWRYVHCAHAKTLSLVSATLGHTADAAGGPTNSTPRSGTGVRHRNQKRLHSLLGPAAINSSVEDGKTEQLSVVLPVPTTRADVDGAQGVSSVSTSADVAGVVRVVCNEWVIQSLILGP